jgi:hypothetical protein
MADYRSSTDQTIPRGIRNNNPGNIKKGEQWQGASGDDGTFVIFADTSWGLRAIARALTTMIGQGYNTIQTLIPQWSATDQQAYINNVAAGSGIGPADILTPDQVTLQDLIRQIVDQENGQTQGETYVSDADIANGISMAQGTLTTLPAAAVVYATANPGTALVAVAVAGLFLALYLLSGDEKPS